MEKQKVYLLRGVMSGNLTAVIAPPVSENLLLEEWTNFIKRADARKVLYPDQYPDNETATLSAVEELRAKHPNWHIIFPVETIPINPPPK